MTRIVELLEALVDAAQRQGRPLSRETLLTERATLRELGVGDQVGRRWLRSSVRRVRIPVEGARDRIRYRWGDVVDRLDEVGGPEVELDKPAAWSGRVSEAL